MTREGGEPVEILFIGSDATAERLSTAAGQEAAFTVRHHHPDAGEVTDAALDCLVVAGGADPNWESIRRLTEPVVLYGGVGDLPGEPAVGRDVNLILERPESGDPTQLFEQIRALTEPATAHETLPDAAATGGGTAAVFLLDGDGSVRWSNAPLERDGRFELLQDVTATVGDYDRLPLFEELVEHAQDGLFVLDTDWKVEYLNRSYAEMLGCDRDQVRGSHVAQLLSPEEMRRVRDAAERLTEGNEGSAVIDVGLEGNDGAGIDASVHLWPRYTGDGLVGAVRDVTRLKRREQRLSRFAAVISHDLRNPLDVALGRAEMLPEVVDLDPETEAHVDEIYDSLERMEHLIEDVLDVARHGETAVDLSPVGLGEAVGGAWGHVETKSAELRVASTAEIQAHRSWLVRLFENLFRNAVEHAGPAALVEVGMLDSGDGFYVADDGRGIPPDRQGLLFDDGFSTTVDGAGLGLSIVHEIAKVHGWSVGIDDGIDGGARFEFSSVAFASDHRR